MSKTEVKSDVEVVSDEKQEKQESQWYYFYSQGCGFCKKSEPIVDELNKSGKYGEILKLDLAQGDNQKLNSELKKEYNAQCGTPWFINAETGKGICGYREKDVIEKWLNGEDIPEPPRPKGPMPKLPLGNAGQKEIDAWKKDYRVWKKENSHLPNLQTTEQILERPRPNTEPPAPPAVNANDEQLDEWSKSYNKWKKENSHLPNLQPVENILDNFKRRRDAMNAQNSNNTSGVNIALENKIKSMESKLDKLIKHLGVK